MKILLQQTNTGLYLEDPKSWTADFEAAMDFGNTEKAFAFAKSERMQNAQVVVAFPAEGRIDLVSYPVPPPPRLPHPQHEQPALAPWQKPIRNPFPA